MNKETILVIDDNRQIANLLARELLPGLGYEALVAYNGKSALEIIHSTPLSLILTDLELPDTNGLALLRQFNSEGYNIPTILITAHGSEEIAVDAFRLGVQDYLIKPVDVEKLDEAITRALSETRLRRETTMLTAQLKEQVSWLTVLSKVGQSVTSTLDLDQLLKRIVEAGTHLTRAEEGFLALLDDQGSQMYLRAVKNIDQEKIKTLNMPVNDSLAGSVIRSGKPLRTTQSPEGTPLKVSTGFLVYSLLHVPILSKGKPLGVLSVVNSRIKRAFKEVDEALLTSLADYAAVALENANLYERARQEINERKRIEQALRESESRYALAVQSANDGLWDWDLRGNEIYYSSRWKSMLGLADAEISADPMEWFNRIHPEDVERAKQDFAAHLKGQTPHFENEHRMLHRDGSYRWMLVRGLAVWDKSGTATRVAGSMTDITNRKFAEEKLLFDAFHDTLTGLPNRAMFMDRLRGALETSRRREGFRFAVLFMDLDRFKDINDSLGHSIGDQLLIAITQLLRNSLRPGDTVARMSGDEFVILMEDIEGINAAIEVVKRIQKKLALPFPLVEHEVFISASIGVVLGNPAYNRPEDILLDADIAMYAAKTQGKATVEVFQPAMRDRLMKRLAIENELRQAIDRQEFRIYYQPIVSLESGELTGLEALVRWQHPARGIIPPAEFMSVAEETGIILLIDRWMLREACKQLREWQQQIAISPELTISVNLSQKLIRQPDFVEHVGQVLKETGLAASCLRLDVPESVILESNGSAAEAFAELRDMGVGIQVDHFSLGFTSLSYLSHFPTSTLKIDRSFIKYMTQDSNQSKIAQSILALTHELGIEAVAEGLETEGQLAQLKALGCEYGQGSIVCGPVDSNAIRPLLSKTMAGQNPFLSWKIGVLSR